MKRQLSKRIIDYYMKLITLLNNKTIIDINDQINDKNKLIYSLNLTHKILL